MSVTVKRGMLPRAKPETKPPEEPRRPARAEARPRVEPRPELDYAVLAEYIDRERLSADFRSIDGKITAVRKDIEGIRRRIDELHSLLIKREEELRELERKKEVLSRVIKTLGLEV